MSTVKVFWICGRKMVEIRECVHWRTKGIPTPVPCRFVAKCHIAILDRPSMVSACVDTYIST